MLGPLLQRLKTKHHPGWLVLQAETGGVRWLHMHHEAGHKPAVTACGFGGGADFASALQTLRVPGKLQRYRCITALRSDEYQLLQAELPSVPDDELRDAFRWGLRELVDKPVDDLGVDYLEIPVDQARVTGGNRPAYAVCAPLTVLQRYQAAFAAQKGKLSVVDVPECAHRNLAGLLAHNEGSIALLSLMTDHCLLSFTFKGELCMARRIEVGMRALVDQPDRRLALLDSMLLEMQRSLDGFERQFHFAPLSRVLVSSMPDDLDISSFLADNIYLPVLPLELGELIDLRAVPALADPMMQAEYLTLLGAGLRPGMH